MIHQHIPSQASDPAASELRKNTPVQQSGLLLQGGQEIVIHHAGQDYRLRVTRQNKLILTK